MKTLSAALLLLATACAHAVELRPGHPDQVIVTKGDTLWDISGRFLEHPWEWPGLWRNNPGITNPDLIYPGDRLQLKWGRGKPGLVHSRGDGRGPAIPTIHDPALKKFFSRPYLVDDEELKHSGYMIAFGDEALLASKGATAYARHLDPAVSDYVIIRPWKRYTDPGTGKMLGHGSLYVGSARVRRHGDPATLVITDHATEIRKGDHLLPATHDRDNLHHHPSRPAESVRGEIIDVLEGVFTTGQYQMVAINLGAEDGLKPGNILLINSAAYPETDDMPVPLDGNRNTEFDDPLARYDVKNDKRWYDVKRKETVLIPEEAAGELLVLRVYDDISFGMIADASRQIRIGYPVQSP
ncbi:MAG: LysM peptidoglycan-binding domain-containing protein [Gammaproteobacteria bacterium]